MEFTDKERLFLINQYEILSRLFPKEKNKYEELIEILTVGYEIEYYKISDRIIKECVSRDKGHFVLDVFNFYVMIEDHKKKNPESLVSSHQNGYFRGYSGNDEGEYLSYARFLVLKQKKFTEQEKYLNKNDRMNSHFPMVGTYKRMLNTWSKYNNEFDLTEGQILEILT